MASRALAFRSVRLMTSRRFLGATSSSSSLLEGVVSAARCTSTLSSHSFQQSMDVFNSVDRRWFSDSRTNIPEEEQPKDAAQAKAPPITAEPAEGEDEVEPAIAEPAELSREELLEAELKKLKHQLLTSLADQENTRRIAQNDVVMAKKFAIKSFAKSLLDVADNLERALQAVPNGMEQNKEEHPVLANLYEGIVLTGQGLDKAFTANGLVKYGEVGEIFDPNKHSALFEYPDSEQTPGTVGQVIKPGFMLSDRVLRPAEVGVIKKTE